MAPCLAVFLALALPGAQAGPPAAAPVAVPDPAAVFVLSQAPPDLAKQAAADRQSLELYGLRFEESTGRILAPHCETPLTYGQFKAFHLEIQQGRALSAAERIEFTLSQVASCKIPKDEAKRTMLSLAKHAELPQLAKKIASGNITAADTQAAQDSAQRYFDGAGQTTARLVTAAVPAPAASPGYSNGARVKAYFDATETKLGALLQQDVISHLSQNPAGHRLLDRFKNARGVVTLPQMLVLKIDKNYGAFYSSHNDSIVYSSLGILEQMAARIPEKDRARLRQEFSDPRRLQKRLLNDARARRDFIDFYDVAFQHELTHAWQARRDKVSVEMNRSNVAGADVLEEEHEAFLEQNRFIHRKLLSDPKEALKSTWFSRYVWMLNDFNSWRDGITQHYLQTWPQSAATLSTMAQMQGLRQAKAFGGLDLSLKGIENILKLKGYEQGDKALTEAQAGHDRRFDAFLKEEYPLMRADGYLALARHFAHAGDAAPAWRFLNAAAFVSEKGPADTADRFAALAQSAPYVLVHSPKVTAAKELRVVVAINKGLNRHHVARTSAFLSLWYRCFYNEARERWDAYVKHDGEDDLKRAADIVASLRKERGVESALRRQIEVLEREIRIETGSGGRQ